MSSVSAPAGRSVMIGSWSSALLLAAGRRALEHQIAPPPVVRFPALGLAVAPDLLAPCDQPRLELARVLAVRRVDLVPAAVALGRAPLRVQLGQLAALLIAEHAPWVLALHDRPARVAEAIVRLVAVGAVHVLDRLQRRRPELAIGLDLAPVPGKPLLDLLDVLAVIADLQRAVVELAQLIHLRLAAAVVGDVPVLAPGLAPLPAVGSA